MRRRRHSVRPVLGRLFERREIHEGLNTDPGWRRDAIDAVVLRLVVGAAADEREDLAGPRIDGDERRLRLPLAPCAVDSSLSTWVRPSRNASWARRCRCRSSVV